LFLNHYTYLFLRAAGIIIDLYIQYTCIIWMDFSNLFFSAQINLNLSACEGGHPIPTFIYTLWLYLYLVFFKGMYSFGTFFSCFCFTLACLSEKKPACNFSLPSYQTLWKMHCIHISYYIILYYKALSLYHMHKSSALSLNAFP